MKKRSKKILSFILSLCMIATILPIQKISANSTFTLQLSKSKQMWFKIDGQHMDFQEYENTPISNVPFDTKITLKVEGIAADKDVKWTSIRGNNFESIKVYEGEEETGDLKEITKVTTNIINFKMTATPNQTNSLPFKDSGKVLKIQSEEKERPYLNLFFTGDYLKYLKGFDFKITDEIKEFDFSTFLQISTESHSPEEDELRELEWKSENTDVFTIKDGIFRPKKNGESTITFKAIYNKDDHLLIPKDTVLEGKIKVIVAVPEKTLSISDDYALLSLFKTKSVPVGAITKIEYTDVMDKTFLAWHAGNEDSNLAIVDEQGQNINMNVKDIAPGQKSFYIIMPKNNVLFAPSFQDLNNGKELKMLKNAQVKLITRFGKILSAPKQVQQADKLLKDDVIEVSDTKETINFNAWKYKGLELNENHSATTATTQFKVSGTDDIEIEAMYHPYANSESKTISGTKGEPLDATIKITLENMHFKNIAMGQDLSSWFVTPIAGLAYISNTAIEEANKVTELVIKISGTPTVTGTDTIVIKIPADSLSTGADKKITNPALNYDIKEKPVTPPTPQPQPDQNSGSISQSWIYDNDANLNSSSGTISKVEKNTKKEDKKENKITEQNPVAEDKTVKVGNVEIEKVFEDVKQDNWFAKSVAFVKENNLMSGVSENQFAPEQKTSRAMIVTVLHRLAKAPQVEQKSLFQDVKGDEYFAEALSWATSQNIVSGYPNGTFGSHDDVTREQLAMILYNYAKAMKFDIKNTANIKQFSDLNMISDYAVEAINWANSAGIILGKGEQLDPKGNATRAEVATIIMRFSELPKK